MKTYAQIQRKASHCREGGNRTFQLRNNSSIGQLQSRLIHSIQSSNSRGVVQAFKVTDDKVVEDVEYMDLEGRVFTQETKDWLENDANNIFKSRHVVDGKREVNRDEILAGREHIHFKHTPYYHSINDKPALDAWLGEGFDEHIYLYDGSLHGGLSNNRIETKWPHPTTKGLAANDEVTCAGIIVKGEEGCYRINNNSGHYLPTSVDAGTLAGAATKLKEIAGDANVAVDKNR